MTLEEFNASLSESKPEVALSGLLQVLWYDAKGQWEKAHDLISEIETPEYCLIHAYLHRKEGDIGNADYWYRRAGEKRKSWSLQEEWEYLVRKFISSHA